MHSKNAEHVYENYLYITRKRKEVKTQLQAVLQKRFNLLQQFIEHLSWTNADQLIVQTPRKIISLESEDSDRFLQGDNHPLHLCLNASPKLLKSAELHQLQLEIAALQQLLKALQLEEQKIFSDYIQSEECSMGHRVFQKPLCHSGTAFKPSVHEQENQNKCHQCSIMRLEEIRRKTLSEGMNKAKDLVGQASGCVHKVEQQLQNLQQLCTLLSSKAAALHTLHQLVTDASRKQPSPATVGGDMTQGSSLVTLDSGTTISSSVQREDVLPQELLRAVCEREFSEGRSMQHCDEWCRQQKFRLQEMQQKHQEMMQQLQTLTAAVHCIVSTTSAELADETGRTGAGSDHLSGTSSTALAATGATSLSAASNIALAGTGNTSLTAASNIALAATGNSALATASNTAALAATGNSALAAASNTAALAASGNTSLAAASNTAAVDT